MGEKSIPLVCVFVVFMILLPHNKSALGQVSSSGGANGSEKIRCLERERQALLKFKEGLRDDHGSLSDWDSKDMDCCKWRGIRCNNRTGRVVVLDLHVDFLHQQPLSGLASLNLSRNNLIGKVIKDVGQMKMLESLDLSSNRLFGEISTSLTQLSFLSVLNLSNNSLSGKIPLSTQLQTFIASAFSENPQLCGVPLPNKWPREETMVEPPITTPKRDKGIEEEE